MGLFDIVQNLLSGVTDSVQGSIGDAVGGLADISGLQDIQDQVTSITDGVTESVSSVSDGATETATSVTEQGQTIIDDFTQNLGL